MFFPKSQAFFCDRSKNQFFILIDNMESTLPKANSKAARRISFVTYKKIHPSTYTDMQSDMQKGCIFSVVIQVFKRGNSTAPHLYPMQLIKNFRRDGQHKNTILLLSVCMKFGKRMSYYSYSSAVQNFLQQSPYAFSGKESMRCTKKRSSAIPSVLLSVPSVSQSPFTAAA